jgi:hypothetical protein
VVIAVSDKNIKQVNTYMDKEKDLDFGEKLIYIDTIKAFSMLKRGEEVSIKFNNIEVYTKTGCKKCNKEKEGTFCNDCGSKISDKLQFERILGSKWLNMKYTDGRLLLDEGHPHSPARSFKETQMELGYFLTLAIWYKRGWVHS